MYSKIIIAAAVLLAGVAGCASEREPAVTQAATVQPAATQKPKPPSPSKSPDNPTAKKYVEAVVAEDPEAMREGLQLAAPGSIAHGYLTHLANAAEADVDGGYAPSDEVGEVKTAKGGYEWCGYLDAEECVTFTDLTMAGGKVSDLRVNGKEVGSRLTLGNGSVVKDSGVTVQFLSAYQSAQANDLIVVYKVTTSGDPIDVGGLSATYRAPDGKQREASDFAGPLEMDANSNALVVAVFSGAKPGGTMTLEGCVDGCDSDYSVKVNVGR